MPEGYTGTINSKMSVLVTTVLDISQPLAKNCSKAEDDGENSDASEESCDNGFNAGSKLVSAYLNSDRDTEDKPKANHGPAANRLTKFSMFDGVNKIMGIEYELLSMIYDFSKPGIILALKPPIMVRKGLLLLKKTNCQVLY